MLARLRLQHRIVIPFALLGLMSASAAAWVATSLFSRAMDARLTARVENAAAVLSQGEFSVNPAILRSASQISGTDILTYTSGGAILASTVDAAQFPGLNEAVADGPTASETLANDGSPVARRLPCGDAPCLVAYKRIVARPGTVIAVIARTSDVVATTRSMTRTIALTTAVSLLVMMLVSQIVARRVTAPLESLVAFTRKVATEGTGDRAAVSEGEVGRLAQSFNEMLDRLDQSKQAVLQHEKLALAGLMAARVAHDVRNPLSSIKMQAQLLGARLEHNPGERRLVDALLRDVRQLEVVVRDLIELARPGELKRSPASLNEVVADVLRQVEPQLSYRRITVELALADGLPRVDLDAERFRQTLLNIIGNAADAMPTGGVLRIATARGDDRGSVMLDIEDNGIGIDPAVRDRLFDPFVSTKRDGVGLGLVNARAVVESHNGTITLVARPTAGTTARIVLPALAAAAPTSAELTHG